MRCAASSTTSPRRRNTAAAADASGPSSTSSVPPPTYTTTSNEGVLEREKNESIAGVQAKGQREAEGCCAGGGGEDRRRAAWKGGRDRCSNGVDEEFRPRRRFKVSGTTFEMDAKYELIKPIGHGAYGVVISALNTETGQKVAIKKITRAFDDLVDAKRILREITLLRKFDHENIISIVDILVPPSPEEFEDVYIVSDLMETDLHRIINSEQDLSLDHVQYFLYQVLRALKYMHSSNVLHRDLKPSNLLLNSNCDLKVCDLGLARDIESGCTELTEYVVTRWYRAPEIMLACQEYTKAIDIWSVGCIFAELMVRRPFFPGDNYIDQLTMICDKLGKPSEDELTFVSTEKARRFIMKLSDATPPSLRDQFPATASDEALDLLSKMLEFNPDKRISVEDALRHPFMKNLHAAKEEPIASFEFCFGFEAEEPRKHRLQELMWEEMRRFHPEQGPWRGEKASLAKAASGSNARIFSHLGREDHPSQMAETKRSSTVPLGRSRIIASISGDGAEASGNSAGPTGTIPKNGGAYSGGNTSNPPVPREGPSSVLAAPSNQSTNCISSSPAKVAGADRIAPTATAVATVFPVPGATAAALPGSAVGGPDDVTPEAHGQSTLTSDQAVAAPPPGLTSSIEPVDEATGARTRAVTRGRAISDRMSTLSSSHECSTAVGGREASAGTTAAAAMVAGVAVVTAAAAAAAADAISRKRSVASVTEPNKRQCVSPAAQAGRRATMAGGEADAMTCTPLAVQGVPTAGKAVFSAGGVSSKDHFQGAPADGTSESLSQAGAGQETPGEASSTLGKRKAEAREADVAGGVGGSSCSPGSGTTKRSCPVQRA